LREHDSVYGNAGTPYYIGKGTGRRAYKPHYGCSAKLPRDKRFVLIIFDKISENIALDLETALIKLFGRIDLNTGCLRNMSYGGYSGSGRSIEERKRRSNAVIGEKNPYFGKHHSKEIREKIKKNRGSTFGDKNGMFGKHHSNDSKKKMKDYRIGKLLTEETKKKKSKAMSGKKWCHNSLTNERKLVNPNDLEFWIHRGFKIGFKFLHHFTDKI
jgi:hypothetical protein